jgi:hypothetical protein
MASRTTATKLGEAGKFALPNILKSKDLVGEDSPERGKLKTILELHIASVDTRFRKGGTIAPGSGKMDAPIVIGVQTALEKLKYLHGTDKNSEGEWDGKWKADDATHDAVKRFQKGQVEAWRAVIEQNDDLKGATIRVDGTIDWATIFVLEYMLQKLEGPGANDP